MLKWLSDGLSVRQLGSRNILAAGAFILVIKVLDPVRVVRSYLSISTVLLAFPALGTAQTLTNLKQPVATAVASAQDLGKIDDSTKMYVTVSLPPSNKAAMEAFATSVSNPASTNFRHFLTPKQIGASYGQSTAVVNSIVSYLKSKGLTVTLVAASNMAVNATGSAAQVSAAFNTTIHKYHSAKPVTYAPADFYSNTSVLKLPSTIAGSVQVVSGLSNYFRKKATSILSPGAARSVYDVLPLYSAGTLGQGRTVGVTNFGGYAISNVPLFYTQFSLPVPAGGLNSNVTVRTIGTGNAATDDGECDLDMEMELGQAPLANLVLYDSSEGPIEALTVESNLNECDIISESWTFGLDSGSAEVLHTLHVQMAMQGITYLTASGDDGTSFLSADALFFPQIDPYVLVVGGTTVTLDSTGLHRATEVGWGGGNSGDSGGGWDPNPVYSFNTLPSYQVGPGVPATIPFRLVPDVALHAALDNVNGFGAYYFFTGGVLSTDANGTSFASPCLAGMLLVAEQKLIQVGTLTAANNFRFGQINPEFYRILRSPSYSSIFFDVTSGTNGPLPNGSTSLAGPGWDTVTGIGTLDVNNFVSFETPPVPLSAIAVGIFDNEGTETPAGQTVAKIASNDGIYLTISSVGSNIGQVATPEYTFRYTTSSEPVDTLSVSTSAIVPKSATNFVYAYNVSTALWDLIGASAGTGALATVSYSIAHPGNYVATDGTIKIVERALYPTRLGSIPFQLKVDSATVTVNQHTF